MAAISRIAFATMAVLTCGMAAAAAQDTERCRGRSGDPIAACTRVITSTKSTREQVGDAYINRGQHYYEKQEYDRAIADFNRAIPLKPKWVQMAYGNRGNAYFSKEENEKALESYDKAISIDPKYASAYTARGLIYEKLGAVERARADYEAALTASSIIGDTKWAHDTARRRLEALKDQ